MMAVELICSRHIFRDDMHILAAQPSKIVIE
jgi:hypothetical protein